MDLSGDMCGNRTIQVHHGANSWWLCSNCRVGNCIQTILLSLTTFDDDKTFTSHHQQPYSRPLPLSRTFYPLEPITFFTLL